MSGITPGQTYSPSIATAGRKDAFHVACVLCAIHPKTQYVLDAGDCVRIEDGKYALHEFPDGTMHDGVVDPFLDHTIYRDSRELFWVFLLPDRVKNLTHTFEILPPTEAEPEKESTPPDDGDWGAACRKCNS